MSDLVTLAIQRLRMADVRLDPGLTDAEVLRLEDRLGFVFGPEHRQLVQTALPVGDQWPDWRSDSLHHLRRLLDDPVRGVLSHVHANDFWPNSWGHRPDGWAARELAARGWLGRAPRLVPLFANRFLTADPQFVPSPIFSIYGTDIIYYGEDLLDYVDREFHGRLYQVPANPTHVPFWSHIAEGAEIPAL